MLSKLGRRARAQRAERTFPRLVPNGRPAGQERSLVDPEGLFTFMVFRPLSDLFLWFWRLERRMEFLYRPQFDKWLRPPLFEWAQALQNSRRQDDHLGLAEEQLLPGEEQFHPRDDRRNRQVHQGELASGRSAAVRRTPEPFGVLRGEFSVLPGLPANLRRGLFAEARTYPAWVRFSGPGPYAPPDIEDLGQCSVGMEAIGMPGPS